MTKMARLLAPSENMSRSAAAAGRRTTGDRYPCWVVPASRVPGRRHQTRASDLSSDLCRFSPALRLGRFLGRLEVGVRARGVVGDIDDLGDLWDGGLDRDLDPLPQRDIDLGATLTAAAQLDIGGTTAHFEQVDEAAVRGDRGVDLPVEHL